MAVAEELARDRDLENSPVAGGPDQRCFAGLWLDENDSNSPGLSTTENRFNFSGTGMLDMDGTVIGDRIPAAPVEVDAVSRSDADVGECIQR
ncbi:MAG: hypothetical protein HKN42_02185 [Granulosicoccus sp.]|nr:hypothetical protein [Granulosicoccus sp.]